MSGKYALIIGNTEYVDRGLAQLTTPSKDADYFARILSDKNICAFDDVKISLNELSSTVIEKIDEFFDQRKTDDLLVFYFSGHGVRDEAGSLYLAFKNTIRSRLRSSAIKADYIREAMDQSRSKRQVVILDCCNSGAFPQGTKAEVGGAMGMVTALHGYGRFVLTASDATQFAWEGDKVIGETQNSLFTHFLLQGLKGEADLDGDGKITVDELYDYTYEQISRITPKQTPTKSASKQEGEIVLRQIERIEDIKPIALPGAIIDSLENPIADIRLTAVQQLAKFLNGRNLGLARSAKVALERLATGDDSQRVMLAARQALKSGPHVENLATQKDKEEIERRPDMKEEAEPAVSKGRVGANVNIENERERMPRQRAEVIQAAREREQRERQLQIQPQYPISREKIQEQKPSLQPFTRSLFVLGGTSFGLVVCAIVAFFSLRPLFVLGSNIADTPTSNAVTHTPFPFTQEAFTPTLPPSPPADTAVVIPPTAFPTIEVPPTSMLPCNQALLVQDVTIPDSTVILTGISFTKVWRLKNTGSCTWTSGYNLLFDHGELMGAPSFQPLTSGSVSPGETVDVSVNLRAPSFPGTYQGDFKLRSPDGTAFGTGRSGEQTFWVRIVVLQPTVAPPPMTPTLTTRVVNSDGMLQILVQDTGFTFWIDQTEVTNRMYKQCVMDNACIDKPGQTNNPYVPSYYQKSEFDNYPVVFVNQADAKNYCAWAGRRIPTANEWTIAAKGSGQRLYDGSTITYYAAGTFDKSDFGVYDMGGQIEEWTEDGLITEHGRIASQYPLDGQNFATGIRCASSP